MKILIAPRAERYRRSGKLGEMNHRAWRAGLSIRELPISFTDRVAGYSKITAGIAKESLRIAWRLRRFFRPRPADLV